MLSYRHSFHAGNFADILKHIVLIEILKHLSKKEKPYVYYDTHSGAGLYDLNSASCQKLAEYKMGIDLLKESQWPELESYFDVIHQYKTASGKNIYPGSPMIALSFLRDQDKASLYELHPTDFDLLNKNVGRDKRIRITKEDGLLGLLSLLPPASRRGLILIDPSYEIKHDYQSVFDTLVSAYKKFSTGVYALWYPVVDRDLISRLENKFKTSGIRDIQRFEFGLRPDSPERGMTSAGMIVINAPWSLREKMSLLLPKLVTESGCKTAHYKSDILVAE